MKTEGRITRRCFLCSAAAGALAAPSLAAALQSGANTEPLIDIHQHTHYSGRSDAQLVDHQLLMGVETTILLPAGRYYGLAADCGGNESVQRLAHQYPDRFRFFANEVANLPEAPKVIAANLERGAIGIGEQKFKVACDSPYIERIAEVAQTYNVPILMHFQHGSYNTGIERFHKILEKYPKVHFIGHAQTWWGHIDRNCNPEVMYPKGKVTPGGLTDRLLTEYPNMHGDLSAGSGLNALRRDEAFTRGFLERHQDKLLYGTDCNDTVGRGPGCDGFEIQRTVRRLASSKVIERKLLYGNARKLLRLG